MAVSDLVSTVMSCATALPRVMRNRAPRVHCITNTVAQAFTANALLASGATPSVTTSPEEIAGFLASADSLLVNLGTLDQERREAISLALDAASEKPMRWVLDPVFVDRSPSRLAFAKELVARKPTVIRLNAAEFRTFTGEEPGTDSAQAFAVQTGAIVALTGSYDIVTDGTRLVTLHNGDPLMGKVTAMGCAGSAVCAAALACDDDAWLGASAALMIFAIAGEFAAEISNGPGGLGFAILDSLHVMTPNMIVQHAWAES
jgi:hydroxyethylthiazole kinase